MSETDELPELAIERKAKKLDERARLVAAEAQAELKESLAQTRAFSFPQSEQELECMSASPFVCCICILFE